MRLVSLVFVVAKNIRSLLSIASDGAFLEGLAIAGAKAQPFFCLFGTTKVVAWYKEWSCLDAKNGRALIQSLVRQSSHRLQGCRHINYA